MEYAIALIDRAAKLCGGSYYKLSKEWGVPESRISEYRHGKARVPLKRVPKLAYLAQVDPQEAYLQVAIEQMPEGSEERDLLGKPLAAIVAGMLLFFVVLGPLLPSNAYAASTNKPYQLKSLYIVEYWKRAWRTIVRWLFRARVHRTGVRPPRPRQSTGHATPRRGLGAIAATGLGVALARECRTGFQRLFPA